MKKKKDNKYVVYLHTLKSDGRKYVGITYQKPEKRWKNGKGYYHNAYFSNAINKYGWNNFKHEILFENLSEEQACVKEQALIKLFNTTNSKFGFNLTSGGEHYECTEEVRKKHSDSMIKINRISYDQIYQLYIVENKTMQECANILGFKTHRSISKILKKYNLKKVVYQADYQCINIPKQDLKYQFIILNKTVTECAEYFNCGRGTVSRYLSKYGLNRINQYNISKEELYHLYVDLNKSAEECAKYFGCSIACVRKYLYEYSINRRNINVEFN